MMQGIREGTLTVTWAGDGRSAMTLRRIIPILATALVVMTAIVLLRSEAARRNYTLSRLERRAGMLRQALSEQELELARLRNPGLIRATLSRMSGGEQTEEP